MAKLSRRRDFAERRARALARWPHEERNLPRLCDGDEVAEDAHAGVGQLQRNVIEAALAHLRHRVRAALDGCAVGHVALAHLAVEEAAVRQPHGTRAHEGTSKSGACGCSGIVVLEHKVEVATDRGRTGRGRNERLNNLTLILSHGPHACKLSLPTQQRRYGHAQDNVRVEVQPAVLPQRSATANITFERSSRLGPEVRQQPGLDLLQYLQARVVRMCRIKRHIRATA
eukprot:scaffold118235_cov69-Phaeocystis_antarctica.AAC.2